MVMLGASSAFIAGQIDPTMPGMYTVSKKTCHSSA